MGCETCHGAGGQHAESDGEILLTLRSEASEACLSCHDGNLAQRYWQGSAHESQDVDCLSCHNIHNGHDSLLQTRFEPDTCYECHVEQRAYAYKRSKHPLRDSSHSKNQQAKMNCSSCHNSHGSQSDKLIAANSVNDMCYECHQEMKAPVVWEHSPVKENCLTCHNPHGANHEKMLAFKEPRLCTQCHENGRHQTLAGQAGTFMVMNRSCSNCHAQVHGTNHPSGLKLKR
jgi:DmsE family decaheme c-type cytochrome